MSKIDLVRKEMMNAMKAGDKPRKEALSLLLSALKNKQIDKRADLTEDEENAIIFKEIKEATSSRNAARESMSIRNLLRSSWAKMKSGRSSRRC